MDTKDKINEYLNQTEDWRSSTLWAIHRLIHQSEPQVKEEWKWNSPTFSFKGKLVCSLGLFRTHVSLQFFQGSFIEDPKGLFHSSSGKKLRSVKIKEGDPIPERGILDLLNQAFAMID